jgi:hypothetical protein
MALLGWILSFGGQRRLHVIAVPRSERDTNSCSIANNRIVTWQWSEQTLCDLWRQRIPVPDAVEEQWLAWREDTLYELTGAMRTWFQEVVCERLHEALMRAIDHWFQLRWLQLRLAGIDPLTDAAIELAYVVRRLRADEIEGWVEYAIRIRADGAEGALPAEWVEVYTAPAGAVVRHRDGVGALTLTKGPTGGYCVGAWRAQPSIPVPAVLEEDLAALPCNSELKRAEDAASEEAWCWDSSRPVDPQPQPCPPALGLWVRTLLWYPGEDGLRAAARVMRDIA